MFKNEITICSRVFLDSLKKEEKQITNSFYLDPLYFALWLYVVIPFILYAFFCLNSYLLLFKLIR